MSDTCTSCPCDIDVLPAVQVAGIPVWVNLCGPCRQGGQYPYDLLVTLYATRGGVLVQGEGDLITPTLRLHDKTFDDFIQDVLSEMDKIAESDDDLGL